MGRLQEKMERTVIKQIVLKRSRVCEDLALSAEKLIFAINISHIPTEIQYG